MTIMEMQKMRYGEKTKKTRPSGRVESACFAFCSIEKPVRRYEFSSDCLDDTV